MIGIETGRGGRGQKVTSSGEDVYLVCEANPKDRGKQRGRMISLLFARCCEPHMGGSAEPPTTLNSPPKTLLLHRMRTQQFFPHRRQRSEQQWSILPPLKIRLDMQRKGVDWFCYIFCKLSFASLEPDTFATRSADYYRRLYIDIF